MRRVFHTCRGCGDEIEIEGELHKADDGMFWVFDPHACESCGRALTDSELMDVQAKLNDR